MIEDSVVEAAMYRCILMCRAEALALDLYPYLGEIPIIWALID